MYMHANPIESSSNYIKKVSQSHKIFDMNDEPQKETKKKTTNLIRYCRSHGFMIAHIPDG